MTATERDAYTVALLPKLVLRFYTNARRDPLLRAHNRLAEAMRYFDAARKNAWNHGTMNSVSADQRRVARQEMERGYSDLLGHLLSLNPNRLPK